MKKRRFITILAGIFVAATIISCENNNDFIVTEDSILPQNFKVEIPDALSRQGAINGRVAVDTVDAVAVVALALAAVAVVAVVAEAVAFVTARAPAVVVAVAALALYVARAPVVVVFDAVDVWAAALAVRYLMSMTHMS